MKKLSKIVLAVLVLIGLGVASTTAYAGLIQRYRTQDQGFSQYYSFFSATTTTATSTNGANGNDSGFLQLIGVKHVTLFFSRGDTNGQGNSGSTLFKVQVTPDGTNWYDYNTLSQNSATSTYPTVVSSVSIAAATSTVITYMQNVGFYGVRCIAIETTDGQHTCAAFADYY